jgi:glycosyltransferase involved in cell wall biosynthesis
LTASPTFSVVIPAYNAHEVIGSAIRSVLQQSRRDFELIVVDDGSTDETPKIVEAFVEAEPDDRVRLIRQANTGTAGARNRGIEESRAPLVSFLDNDDLWMPTYLQEMGLALDANPDAGLAYTDGWSLVDRLHRIRRGTAMERSNPPDPPPRDRDAFLERLLRMNFILSSATVRRPTLDVVGGFAPGLGGCDDYDLWIRIAAAGYRAVRAPGLLVIQRDTKDSQSKDSLMMLRGLDTVLRRALKLPIPADARVAAEDQLAAVNKAAAAVSGSGSVGALAYRARSALARIRHRLLRHPRTYSDPPPEVAAAFPDLDEL